MDKYSYNPNSRIAKRIKERERKRRRRKRITAAVCICAVAAGAAFFAVGKTGFELPEFDLKAGVMRVSRMIKKDAPAQADEKLADDEPQEVQGGDEYEPEEAADIGTDFETVYTAPQNSGDPSGIYPPPSENNNLLDIFKNAAGEEEKICCLTFDDGPDSRSTPKILGILSNYGVKATFFELGEKAAANTELVKRTYDEGHLLANHTYTQKYSTVYSGWETFFDEVTKTGQIISEVTGEAAYPLVRFPGGSFNSGVYGAVKQEYKAQLAQNGYYYIDWSVDSGDDGTRNADGVLSYIKDYCGKRPVVLLLEDSPSRKATVDALPRIIEYLQGCGYVFKRLDEINYYTAEDMPERSEEVGVLSNTAEMLLLGRGRIV